MFKIGELIPDEYMAHPVIILSLQSTLRRREGERFSKWIVSTHKSDIKSTLYWSFSSFPFNIRIMTIINEIY